MNEQLALDFGPLSQGDLQVAIMLGLVEPVGSTPDGRVTEYALTGRGRILLSNQASRKEEDHAPAMALKTG